MREIILGALKMSVDRTLVGRNLGDITEVPFVSYDCGTGVLTGSEELVLIY